MFENADLIHRYTRADALRDGVLIDVSAVAREADICSPVALTAAVWQRRVPADGSELRQREQPMMPRRESWLSRGCALGGNGWQLRLPEVHRLVPAGAGKERTIGAEADASPH